MKLETTNKKKYPCEYCVDGIYMKVEQEWWCDKHLMYACQMEKNRLCEKFERDDAVSRTPTRPAQEALAIERYQDLVDYFDDDRDREEAIAQLEMDRDLCNFNPMTGEEEPMNEDCRKSAEALNIAIKALKQEPCEDAISRQDVLDMMQIRMGAKELYKAVYDLPSVTPTRKKGKWIRHEERKPLKYGYELIIKGKCSNCGEVFGETYKMNYCPNCGARIGGEE